MHVRSGIESAALRIIEEVIKMDDKIRILYHTKGYILSCMTTNNKAEEIINEGLKKAKSKEALWIESANINAFIGEHPSRIRSLELAVKMQFSQMH